MKIGISVLISENSTPKIENEEVLEMERKKSIFDENADNLVEMLVEKMKSWGLLKERAREVEFTDIHTLFSKLDEIFRFKGSLSKKYVRFIVFILFKNILYLGQISVLNFGQSIKKFLKE